MTKIRLYTQSINPFTAKVELALSLKRLPYELEVSDDLDVVKRWSPVTQLLPVIEIDGTRIEDSEKILKALQDRFPEPSLLASDPKTARAQERLAEWSDSSFLFYWNTWREARFPRPGDEQVEENPGRLEKLRSGIVHAFGGHESPWTRRALREAEVMNGIAARLSDLSAFLGERPFYYADEPSLADITVYGMLRILYDGPMTGAHDLILERPELLAYMERMEQLTVGDNQRYALEPPAA